MKWCFCCCCCCCCCCCSCCFYYCGCWTQTPTFKVGKNRVRNIWDIAKFEFAVGGGWWCKVIFVSNPTFAMLGWVELWVSWGCEILLESKLRNFCSFGTFSQPRVFKFWFLALCQAPWDKRLMTHKRYFKAKNGPLGAEFKAFPPMILHINY